MDPPSKAPPETPALPQDSQLQDEYPTDFDTQRVVLWALLLVIVFIVVLAAIT